MDPLLPSADKPQMTGVRREPRIAVMILVEASWQDPSGKVLTVPARMEDKSASGACIRLRRQIGVGSRLQIQCRRERFSATVRYCRNVGMDYLAGIQRDPAMMAHTQPVAAAPAQVTNFESKLSREITAVLHTPAETRQVPAAKAECVSISSAPPRAKPLMSAPPRPNERESAPPNKASHEKKVDVERKSMRHKWLELPRRQEKRNGMPSDSIGGNHSKLNHSPKVLSSEPISRPPFSERGFPVELLPMDDVYRNAGILNSLKGYGINKVVEMIRSAHIRDLPKEMKRAAVLMALDSAGVALDHVLRDAKARQDALDCYEADQRKQLEADWKMKEEQNAQIEAELERVRAQYMARVGRNMDGIAREKASFESWLTLKRQEFQAIADAAELCSKADESVSQLLPEVSMLGSNKVE